MNNIEQKIKKEYVFYRESYIESFLSDITTFSFVIGSMALNHYFLGDSWVFSLFFVASILMKSLAYSKVKTFKSKKELEDYLKSEEV